MRTTRGDLVALLDLLDLFLKRAVTSLLKSTQLREKCLFNRHHRERRLRDRLKCCDMNSSHFVSANCNLLRVLSLKRK